MRKNLLEFLFGAPTLKSNQNLGEEVIKLFEEADNAEIEQMVANKKPLATALKAIGISNEVTEGPNWCEIRCEDGDQYRNHCRLLADADNMHKLAELGWVAAKCGDQAMNNELPEYKLGFIELNMLEQNPKNTQDTESQETIIKNAQKFSATPLDRDDKLNPVDNDKKVKPSDDHQKGVGKPKDGDKPEGKIKDSLTAKGLADSILEDTDLQEMTSCSSIPPVESPMGVHARKPVDWKTRMEKMRKRRGENAQGKSNR